MKRLLLLVPAMLALVAMSVPSNGRPSNAAASLVQLCEESGLFCQEVKPDVFLIKPAEEFGQGAVAAEATLSSGATIVYLWTPVVQIPEDYQHPAALLRRMAEINGDLPVGKVGISNELDGTVVYASSFWLDAADGKVLRYEIGFINDIIHELRGALEPYVAM